MSIILLNDILKTYEFGGYCIGYCWGYDCCWPGYCCITCGGYAINNND